MRRKKIVLNASSAVLQVIMTACVYFFLYRYLLAQLGAAQLGIWSLVLATSSVANLANFGLTSGLVKFVADYSATERKPEIQQLIFTAFVTLAVFFFVLVAIFYGFGTFILKRIVEAQYLDLAIKILPVSLLCLWINALGGVFTSTLEGLQKNYLRNLIYSIGTVLFFVLSHILLPRYKLVGVAYAQLGNSIFVLLVAGYFAIKQIEINVSNWKWVKRTFKEIISYGLRFQVISICQMLFEPTTKILLSNFGGLSSLGYYELASRLIWQVRGLIINANQVMIPVFAEASHKDHTEVRTLYLKSFNATILVSFPIMAGVVFFSPLISMVWIGHVEMSFITFLFILSIGNLMNISGGPAYFGFLGQGNLMPVMIAEFAIGVVNAVCGYILGILWGGYGTIIAWTLALGLGSLILTRQYVILNKMKSSLLDRRDVIIILLSSVFMLTYFLYASKSVCFNCRNSIWLFTAQIVVFISVFVITFFRNNFVRELNVQNFLKKLRG